MFETVMTTTEISVILATEEHVLSGNVAANGQRLLDLLSDTNTDFVRLSDAHLFRRKGNTRIASLPEVVVAKKSVGFVIPNTDAHEAPKKRFMSIVKKNQYSVFLLVFGYEVRGTLQLLGAGDPVSTLCNELGNFVAVPNGSVAFDGTSPNRPGSQVVIVNKDLISLMEISRLDKPVSGSETNADQVDKPMPSGTCCSYDHTEWGQAARHQ